MPEPCNCEERRATNLGRAEEREKQRLSRAGMKAQQARIELNVRMCQKCPFVHVVSWPVKLSSSVQQDVMQPGYYCAHPVNRNRPARMLIATQEQIEERLGQEAQLTDYLILTRGGSPFPENCPLKIAAADEDEQERYLGV